MSDTVQTIALVLVALVALVQGPNIGIIAQELARIRRELEDRGDRERAMFGDAAGDLRRVRADK